MNSCTERQRGQALVEMAVIIPVGLILLLVVGYLGRALIEKQTVVSAARFAAREAAMAATRSAAEKATGAGVIREAGSASERGKNANDAAGKQLEAVPPSWAPISGAGLTQLRPVPLGAYGWGFIADHRENVDGKTMRFQIGFVLYGAKVRERLAFLEPARKSAQGASRMLPNPSRGLSAPLEVSGAAYMPGEAPLHHPAIGLVESNTWIKDILEGN